MTNSICTTVVEVKKTVKMALWQPMSKPTTWKLLTHKAKWFLKFDNSSAMSCLWHIYDRLCCLSNVKLSWQRHWQVMMYWFMSSCH